MEKDNHIDKKYLFDDDYLNYMLILFLYHQNRKFIEHNIRKGDKTNG